MSKNSPDKKVSGSASNGGGEPLRLNVYVHKIDLVELHIPNCPRDDFRKKLTDIPYRGYKVENIGDGREIVITKPGGKSVYGRSHGDDIKRSQREDFLVFVRSPQDGSLWLMSHADILNDLKLKGEVDASATIRLIDAFERACGGEEPDHILANFGWDLSIGESPEVLLKAYKWIWGQEDCNYPPPRYQGRYMCMVDIRDLKTRLQARVQREGHR